MPDDKKTSTTAAKEEAPAEEPATDPDAYAPERLIDESSARFGVPPHVAAGAFATSDSETLSLNEAQKLIDDFLKTEVEVDNPLPTAPEAEEE